MTALKVLFSGSYIFELYGKEGSQVSLKNNISPFFNEISEDFRGISAFISLNLVFVILYISAVDLPSISLPVIMTSPVFKRTCFAKCTEFRLLLVGINLFNL